MRKNFFCLCVAFGLFGFAFTGSFYDLPLTSIDNQPINLRSFQGKRIMVVILPLGTDDGTGMTPGQIGALAASQTDSLEIIGIPAVEQGYIDTEKEQLKSMYADMPANFILAAGMRISKSSGQNQSPLFQWLTDINRNGFFDRDATEIGQKFFINKYGHLYAVFGSRVMLSNPIMQRVLSEHGH